MGMINGLRFVTIIALVAVFSMAYFTAESKEIKTNNEGKSKLEFLSKSDLNLKMVNSIGQIGLEGIGMQEGDFLKLNITGYANSYDVGSPNIPVKRQLIEIPHGATPVINIISFDVVEYDLADFGTTDKIIPVQLPQPKCGDSPDFVCNTAQYNTNSFLTKDRVTIDVIGKMREVRIARINISTLR